MQNAVPATMMTHVCIGTLFKSQSPFKPQRAKIVYGFVELMAAQHFHGVRPYCCQPARLQACEQTRICSYVGSICVDWEISQSTCLSLRCGCSLSRQEGSASHTALSRIEGIAQRSRLQTNQPSTVCDLPTTRLASFSPAYRQACTVWPDCVLPSTSTGWPQSLVLVDQYFRLLFEYCINDIMHLIGIGVVLALFCTA